MAELTKEHCHSGAPALAGTDMDALLEQVPGWQAGDDRKRIIREFRFKDYYETIAFVNAAAWIANRENHHPDMEVHYNRCKVAYSTHDVGGLSRNDFICAARINELFDGSNNSSS